MLNDVRNPHNREVKQVAFGDAKGYHTLRGDIKTVDYHYQKADICQYLLKRHIMEI